MEYKENQELKLALEYVQYTGENIFLTGKAGTGKTTFLHKIREKSSKRMIVVAPTGVAAINAKGVTIHSFFQMPFTPYIPIDYIDSPAHQDNSYDSLSGHWKLNKEKINIIRSLDLLVIDEISMVRADILDQVDAVLRRYKNKNKLFGGVQLLMIGDIQQLAPVIKRDEWELLQPYYETIFFFSSKALQKTNFISIELKHIFRQSDDTFIKVLNKIRENKMDEESYAILNKRYIPGFRPKPDDGYITLTTHNAQAKEINDSELVNLPDIKYEFTATVDGQFPEYAYPTDLKLEFKPGAQVMFVKNDISKEKLYYNGKIGKITRIEDDIIFVKCPDDTFEIPVDIAEWQNMKYTLDKETKEIQEDIIGTFLQYPLKLAWAITIHKSQGLTFERAIIDAKASFAHGQVYVALSRCKTLEGLVLSTELSKKGIISNSEVASFSKNVEENPPKQEWLDASKIAFQLELVNDLFDFEPILIKMFVWKKTMKEDISGISTAFSNKLNTMIDSTKAEIIEVAHKFSNQLKQLSNQDADIEKNKLAQERIIKASNYFDNKIKDKIIDVLPDMHIETDNSSVKKNIKKFKDELLGLSMIKSACLESAKSGFDVSQYMETRAKEAIEKAKTKSKPKKVEIQVSEEIEHPELYKQLKNWRDKLAEQENKPAYMIIQVKSMHQISNLIPLTTDQLMSISGFGKRKVEQYGAELLDIITLYAEENNLQSKIDNSTIILSSKKKNGEKKKTEKIDTKQLTLELYQQGKTVKEIAEERGMVDRTIEKHLAQLIESGKINIEKLVAANKIQVIMNFFSKAENFQLSPAKKALGEDYSWADLDYVKSHMNYINKP